MKIILVICKPVRQKNKGEKEKKQFLQPREIKENGAIDL